jgi:nucleoside-diphosphate-sugar epimerase
VKSLLITGGTGFIGKNLILTAKKNGYKVTSLARNKSKIADKNILCDLSKDQPKIVEDYDLIVHAAGLTNNNFYFSNYLSENSIGMMNFIKELCSKDSTNFILLSGISLFNNLDEDFIDENSNLVNLDSYSLSKRSSEVLLSEAGTVGKRLIIRLPGVLGNGAPTSWPVRIVNSFLKNEEVEIFDYQKLYNHCIDLDSLSNFIISMVNFEMRNYDIVHLAADSAISIKECTEILANNIDVKIILKKSSRIKNKIILIDKAKNLYGYMPLSVRETLERYIKSIS